MIRKIVLSVFIAGLFLTGLKAHSQQIADIENFSDTVNTSRYLKFHLTTIFEIEPAFDAFYQLTYKFLLLCDSPQLLLGMGD